MAALVFFAVLFVIITTFGKCINNSLSEVKMEKSDDDYAPSRSRRRDNLEKLLKLQRILLIVWGVAFFVISAFNSIFITTVQQTGCVSTFGTVRKVEGSGPHFKLPYFSNLHIYDATAQRMSIGYDDDDETVPEEAQMITSDLNFVNVDFDVEYYIVDPIEYTYGSDYPEEILRNICIKSIRKSVGLSTVDETLTTGKSRIESEVLADVRKELENVHIGLYVSKMPMQDSDPPTKDVANAFKEVNDAKTNKDKSINEATATGKVTTEAAEAKAAEILASAEATKVERVNQAAAEVATFDALFDEYKKNPSIVEEKMYLDTIKAIYPNMEIILGDGNVVQVNGNTADVAAAGAVN